MNRLLLILPYFLMMSPVRAQVAEAMVPSLADQEDISQLKTEEEDLIALRLESKVPLRQTQVMVRMSLSEEKEMDIQGLHDHGLEVYEPQPGSAIWGNTLSSMDEQRQKLQEELSWMLQDRDLDLGSNELQEVGVLLDWEVRIAHCQAQIKALDIVEQMAEDALMEMEDQLFLEDWAAIEAATPDMAQAD